MAEIKYTRQEKQEIVRSLNIALDDLRELWKKSQSKVVETIIPSGSYSNPHKIVITSLGILLKEYKSGRDSYVVKRLELNTPFGNIKRRLSLPMSLKILNNYKRIRENVESEIEHDIFMKQQELGKASIVRENYDRSVDIEIEAPPSQNSYTIDVKKSDGKNIGTINLGNKSVRIITEGNIFVVDKSESDNKVKRI